MKPTRLLLLIAALISTGVTTLRSRAEGVAATTSAPPSNGVAIDAFLPAVEGLTPA